MQQKTIIKIFWRVLHRGADGRRFSTLLKTVFSCLTLLGYVSDAAAWPFRLWFLIAINIYFKQNIDIIIDNFYNLYCNCMDWHQSSCKNNKAVTLWVSKVRKLWPRNKSCLDTINGAIPCRESDVTLPIISIIRSCWPTYSTPGSSQPSSSAR